MASLVSLNVGMPKDVPWQGRTVHTGVFKHPVDEPRMVRRLNVDGDGQGDLGGHGGEQRAVLVYQTQSYRHWQQHFGRDDLEYGQFGENFTVDGLPDDEVCVGDRYRIGDAEFEVTQPRVTCYRVGLSLGEPAMPALLVAHHRPGFYLRVITEGMVRSGDEIVRTSTGPGAISVADIDALLYLPDRDLAQLRIAVTIPALSPGWQQSFRDLLNEAEREIPAAPQITAEREIAAVAPAIGSPGWTGFRSLRVTRVVPESPTVTSIQLAAADDTRLPAAQPGQYLTIRVPGAGDPAPVRSYSLSSAPGADHYRISVKREQPGVVSSYLHEHLRAGAIVDAAAPRGDFVPDNGDDPILLVSAGIGATPVLAMLHALSQQQVSRDVWWLHTTRDPQGHAFGTEAHHLLATLPRGHEHIFNTSTQPYTTAISGRPTVENLTELGVPTNATAYLCGPDAFMADLRDTLVQIGISADRIHTELFGALPSLNPGITDRSPERPHRPSGPPGTGPLVTFARSGLEVRWADRYRTLLEFAEACDVPTRWSCRSGVCHNCTTQRLSGTADYPTPPLEPPGPDEILICCASPRTDLVLGL